MATRAQIRRRCDDWFIAALYRLADGRARSKHHGSTIKGTRMILPPVPPCSASRCASWDFTQFHDASNGDGEFTAGHVFRQLVEPGCVGDGHDG